MTFRSAVMVTAAYRHARPNSPILIINRVIGSVCMSWLEAAEKARKTYLARLAQQTSAPRAQEKAFIETYKPLVIAMLREIGWAWGGIDVDNPPPPPNSRTWVDMLLGPPPPQYVQQAFRVYELGGPFSRGNNVCISFGLLEVGSDGGLSVGYKKGEDAGGLRVSLVYNPDETPPEGFLLAANSHHLPAYLSHFPTLDDVHTAVQTEWPKGTFLGPYFVDTLIEE